MAVEAIIGAITTVLQQESEEHPLRALVSLKVPVAKLAEITGLDETEVRRHMRQRFDHVLSQAGDIYYPLDGIASLEEFIRDVSRPVTSAGATRSRSGSPQPDGVQHGGRMSSQAAFVSRTRGHHRYRR